MSEKMQCYSCGVENTIGNRFCISCGEKFFYQCPQCNAEIEPEFDFCLNCGTKLDWSIKKEEIKNSFSDKEIFESKEQRSNTDKPKEIGRGIKKRGLSPWTIAFIIIIVLIILIFVFEPLI